MFWLKPGDEEDVRDVGEGAEPREGGGRWIGKVGKGDALAWFRSALPSAGSLYLCLAGEGV